MSFLFIFLEAMYQPTLFRLHIIHCWSNLTSVLSCSTTQEHQYTQVRILWTGNHSGFEHRCSTHPCCSYLMLTRGNQLEVSLLSGRAEKTIKNVYESFSICSFSFCYLSVNSVHFFLAHWDEKGIKITTAPLWAWFQRWTLPVKSTFRVDYHLTV